jgi:transcriptional regulator with XRE-family HTH domain
MARSNQIVETLKQELRAQGLNYKQLAAQLGLSESTIKHMFSSKNFSLKRLDKICDLLGMELTDLVSKFAAREPKLEQLTVENEKRLISDIPLLIVAYCITNQWSVDDILRTYDFSETECVRCLAQLDRMKMIELLPENRVRLLISNNFQWHKNGPIEQFFRTEVQSRFFSGAFAEQDALHSVKLGDLSDRSITQVIERLNSVGELYEELSKEDRKQPFDSRFGTSMVLAIRKWEFDAFKDHMRNL